jgi:putative phage-type endonuclease
MEQKSNDWYAWRNAGLGASDAPIVMGVSPWTTPHQLWEYKTGKAARSEGNWATKRGNEMEPRARAHLELKVNLDFPAILVEHPEFTFMRASLDGYNAANKIVLEIKCPGKEDHENAMNGIVPEKYYPQLQHQLFVTGAEKNYYYSYSEDANKNATGYLIEVLPDKEYMKLLFKKMCEFWICVRDNIEPELTDKDYKSIRNAEITVLLKAWKESVDNLSVLEKRVDNLKKQILSHPDIKDRRCKSGNFRISLVNRKGNIKYDKIPELQGIDLERYRSNNTIYQTISYKESKNEAD